MKKVLFIAVIALLGLGNLNAQNFKFGLVGGFHNLSAKLSGDGGSLSVDAQGFYIGVLGEFNFSENVNLQTELQYASVSQDGNATDFVVLPIMVKYYISQEFNLQVGPQLDFLLSESEGEKGFGIGLGIGAGFDINENFFINTRYAFGLTNRVNDTSFGINVKYNTFQAGLGYRF